MVFTQFMLSLVLLAAPSEDIDPTLPKQVDVLPVFFVAKGESLPTEEQKSLLMKHLKMSQDRYRELLGDTFRLAKQQPDVYRSRRPFEFYKGDDGGARHYVGELLEHYEFNRFNCPYVFLILVMNPREDYPTGGGRPCNGGFNTGCGLVQMSSYALDKIPNFQSTLEHEVAHSFGLPHVDVYGYDMKKNDSIMSYNPSHHTQGLRPSDRPGLFIPEDLRGLALNKRVFSKFRFDPAIDLPRGVSIAQRIIGLGPLDIPGQPFPVPAVTTSSGETFGSKASNVVGREIKPSKGPGVTYDASTMWHSAASETGWVALDVAFPFPVTLARMGIYTQHSGQFHPANRARIQIQDRKTDEFRDVVEGDMDGVDALIDIPETRGKTWRVHLRAGSTMMVVVRGLRFFSPTGEIFPPLVPYRE